MKQDLCNNDDQLVLKRCTAVRVLLLWKEIADGICMVVSMLS